jgi:hypothetical protein
MIRPIRQTSSRTSQYYALPPPIRELSSHQQMLKSGNGAGHPIAPGRTLVAIIRLQGKLALAGEGGHEGFDGSGGGNTGVGSNACARPDGRQAEHKKPQVDESAYKAALERIPEPKEKYDPWGVARPGGAGEEDEIASSII